MSASKGKCYLKRKRFLNEVSQEILTTLQRIHYVRNEILSDSQIKDEAQKYAQKIEAVCLTPKYKMSNDEYHNVLMLKTQELCEVLKRSMLPSQSSPIPITVSQQQQAMQQVPQRNSVDIAGLNEDNNNYNTMNNDMSQKLTYFQDNRYDLQMPPEIHIHSQKIQVPVAPQAVSKRSKSRKSNGKSSAASKLSANQALSLPATAQCQSEGTNIISGSQNNISNNDQQKCYNSSNGNDANTKMELNINNVIQNLDINEEVCSNLEQLIELHKNCLNEGDANCANRQNINSLPQLQVQNQFLPNEVGKGPIMRYNFDEPINDSGTIFPIATKDADIFPIIESNCAKADPFNLSEESFFDSNCIKEGLEFGDSLSFSLM